ncbi:MAG: hypothetical protein H0W76_01430 [Pyrinomonadaceae bacterium]|nr:hypothetical protein [Pyrinomonadaceae bacterium]
MIVHNFSDNAPGGWLAFELSVLRRLKFYSVVNPFAGESTLDVYLKRWGASVASNDAARWAWTRATARVANNTERLAADEVAALLEEAYVPRHKLYNPALRRWFGETDAWWFDNIRAAVDELFASETARALALDIAMMVGDYALSFDDETREMRQPLSRVFRRLWEAAPAPIDNERRNTAASGEARDFLAGQQTDLLFLRLPRPARRNARHSSWAWREEWIRGGDDFWNDFESERNGRLGARVETRQQYLNNVEELLATAAHLPTWAIAHTENGFISTEELVETIRRVRKVGTIYSKDFSELMGARAVIVTAEG